MQIALLVERADALRGNVAELEVQHSVAATDPQASLPMAPLKPATRIVICFVFGSEKAGWSVPGSGSVAETRRDERW